VSFTKGVSDPQTDGAGVPIDNSGVRMKSRRRRQSRIDVDWCARTSKK
jgi:hypothetical protein